MKEQIEARIAALKAELAAEEDKLKNFVENVPAEIHNLATEAWEKLVAFVKAL